MNNLIHILGRLILFTLAILSTGTIIDFSGDTAHAQEQDLVRTWRSSDGKWVVKGSLAEVKNGVAYVKNEKGDRVSCAVDSLSVGDQIMVKRFLSGTMPKSNPPSAKASKTNSNAQKSEQASAEQVFDDNSADPTWFFRLGEVQAVRAGGTGFFRPFCTVPAQRLKDGAGPFVMVYGINCSEEIDRIADSFFKANPNKGPRVKDLKFGLKILGPNGAMAIQSAEELDVKKEGLVSISIESTAKIAGPVSFKAQAFRYNGGKWIPVSNAINTSVIAN